MGFRREETASDLAGVFARTLWVSHKNCGQAWGRPWNGCFNSLAGQTFHPLPFLWARDVFEVKIGILCDAYGINWLVGGDQVTIGHGILRRVFPRHFFSTQLVEKLGEEGWDKSARA
jgi:hypothetical protein